MGLIKKLFILSLSMTLLFCSADKVCVDRVTESQVWTQQETELVELINDYREGYEIQSLVKNEDLKIEASKRLLVLYPLPSITHEGVDKVFLNLGNKCYTGITEILGEGYYENEGVLSSWIKSKSHNKALINPESKYIGVEKSINKGGTNIYIVIFSKD